jgi:hypothetical protein
MKKPNAEIHLHIEELILHGFAPGDRQRLGEAVQQELVRLLAEQSPSLQWSNNRQIDRVEARSFSVAAGNVGMGNQIAGAVHHAISQ